MQYKLYMFLSWILNAWLLLNMAITSKSHRIYPFRWNLWCLTVQTIPNPMSHYCLEHGSYLSWPFFFPNFDTLVIMWGCGFTFLHSTRHAIANSTLKVSRITPSVTCYPLPFVIEEFLNTRFGDGFSLALSNWTSFFLDLSVVFFPEHVVRSRFGKFLRWCKQCQLI